MMVNLQEEASLPFKTKIQVSRIRRTWKYIKMVDHKSISHKLPSWSQYTAMKPRSVKNEMTLCQELTHTLPRKPPDQIMHRDHGLDRTTIGIQTNGVLE
jgi:hypothetical protein